MLAACTPSACRATGRGLQPKGVRVQETADFKVLTKGAGTGDLRVVVKGPSEWTRADGGTRGGGVVEGPPWGCPWGWRCMVKGCLW